MNNYYFVYILECSDGTLYTGCTNDVDQRVREHNAGTRGAKYTRAKRPVKLVWTKRCLNRSYAMRQEIQIKKLARIDKLKLVAGARLDNVLRR